MKLPLFFSLGFLSISLFAFAEEPVFDIPKETAEKAQPVFAVDVLATDSGEAGHAAFSTVWNERGLSVHVTVRKQGAVILADEDKELDKKESVEIFFGAKKEAKQFYKIVVGGYSDDAKKPRVWIVDSRKPAPEKKPAPEVKTGAAEGGYFVDVLLPWGDLFATAPKAGDEASLQVCVNSVDAAGEHKTTATWHPGYRAHDNPEAMYRIRLTAKGSPAVRIEARAMLDKGSPRVDVVAPKEFAGKPVEVKAGEKTIASGVFQAVDDCAHATFLVPQSATGVTCAAGKADVDFTVLPDLVFAGVLNVHPYFKLAVFSGTKFPVCDLEPGTESENALGKCTLTPTFYDADYNEVKAPGKNGRYGAIIHVETANGQNFNRYVTLYRAPSELLGRDLRAKFSGIELPQELGIDPQVISPRVRNVDALFNNQLRAWDGMNRGPDAAVVLAWLSEQKADAPATDVMRNGPFAADQKWWYGLKKKTGNLRADYFVHVPPDYDKDPQKKWPLIVFLHGSGERGYDLKLLERQPLPQGIGERKDFPFIVVAPQCNPNEWWSIPELDDLLDSLPAKYRIDPDRVYLTGLSMGGYGTWAWAAAEPKRFAAIVPICGGGDPQDVEQFKDLPVWAFHGDTDDAVPMERSQEMVEALKKAGGDPKFTIVAGAGHIETWLKAYSTPELFEWLLQQKRK